MGGVRLIPALLLNPLRRGVVLAAVLGLLALPVEYRGGAKEPHAHAAYQLWYDAAHGSVAHHHTGAIGHAHRAEGRETRAVAPPLPAAAVEAGEDVPRLVTLSIGGTKIPVLLTVVLVAILVSIRLRLAWREPRVVVGRTSPPATPPPRPLPVFA